MTIPYLLLGVVGARAMAAAAVAPPGQPPPPIFTYDSGGEAAFLLLPICGAECLGLWFLIGAVYAVARPRRGLQDVLAGTCLVPK